VAPTRFDPATKLGIIPSGPLPRWGWETIPDQYRRRWADDDEEHDEPANPGSDLSPLQPMMGPTTTGLSGRIAGNRALFVRVWCEVVDTGVSRARFAPGFGPSKIACDSWTFVSYRWVSRSSRYIVDQNDSIIALSTEATRPIEPGSLAWRSRCPNAQEVYCPGCHDRLCPAAVAVANTPSAGHRRPSR
jgi:hypothetical protein